MSYTHSETRRSIYHIAQDWKSYDLKLKIQRGLVWNKLQKSKLIHSLIMGVDIPKVYTYVENGIRKVMDGKQRTNAAMSFYNGELVLDDETPDAKGEVIAGKPFIELPEHLQKAFENSMLTIVEYTDLTEEERDELFLRYNGGTKLTAMEINKALVGTRILEDIEPIRNKPFIEKFLGKKQIEKNKDSYVVWQMLMLNENNYLGRDIGEKSVNAFSRKLKHVGIEQDVLNHVGDMLDYLDHAIPVPEKAFSKLVEIPMLFVAAHEALKLGKTPAQFGGWVQDFYSRRVSGDVYAETKKGGIAQKRKVQDRIDILLEDLEKNIDSAPEYKKPEVVESNRRGRRPKVKATA